MAPRTRPAGLKSPPPAVGDGSGGRGSGTSGRGDGSAVFAGVWTKLDETPYPGSAPDPARVGRRRPPGPSRRVAARCPQSDRRPQHRPSGGGRPRLRADYSRRGTASWVPGQATRASAGAAVSEPTSSRIQSRFKFRFQPVTGPIEVVDPLRSRSRESRGATTGRSEPGSSGAATPARHLRLRRTQSLVRRAGVRCRCACRISVRLHDHRLAARAVHHDRSRDIGRLHLRRSRLRASALGSVAAL